MKLKTQCVVTNNSVTTFLAFFKTRKCQGILKRSWKRQKVRERYGNLCSQGNLQSNKTC